MAALRIARIALFTSVAVYAVTLLLGLTKIGAPDLLSPGFRGFSAVACVILQIRAVILERRVR
jgi:hypothetical protein